MWRAKAKEASLPPPLPPNQSFDKRFDKENKILTAEAASARAGQRGRENAGGKTRARFAREKKRRPAREQRARARANARAPTQAKKCGRFARGKMRARFARARLGGGGELVGGQEAVAVGVEAFDQLR